MARLAVGKERRTLQPHACSPPSLLSRNRGDFRDLCLIVFILRVVVPTDPMQQACVGTTREVGVPGWRWPGHTLGMTGMRDEFWAEVARTHTGRCELRSFPHSAFAHTCGKGCELRVSQGKCSQVPDHTWGVGGALCWWRVGDSGCRGGG